MRGGRLFVFASVLYLAGCSATPREQPAAPVPPPSGAPFPKRAEESRPAAQQPLREPEPAPVLFAPRNPIKGGGDDPQVRSTPPVETMAHPSLRLQKELVAKHPASDEEKLRLAVLHAVDGDYEKAELVFSRIRSEENRFKPYFEFFLRIALGDHQEARKLLAGFKETDRVVVGFVIERAVLCSRVRRFRDYAAASSDHVRPGGYVLLYVEPRNFTLKGNQDRYILHLKYEWELFDDRSRKQAVPAWEKARPADREDRVTYAGPVTEFYQSFKLPLPRNLAMGHYRVKVTVTDAHSGKSDRVFVPIYVTAVESTP